MGLLQIATPKPRRWRAKPQAFKRKSIWFDRLESGLWRRGLATLREIAAKKRPGKRPGQVQQGETVS